MIEVVVTVLVVVAIVVMIASIRDTLQERKEETKEPSTGSDGEVQLQKVSSVVQPAPDLDKMTKQKLEEYGRTRGIELDRRKTKANMLSDLRAHLK